MIQPEPPPLDEDKCPLYSRNGHHYTLYPLLSDEWRMWLLVTLALSVSLRGMVPTQCIPLLRTMR